MKSSTSKLIILFLARIAFDLDFQMIILFFNIFSESYQIDISLLGFLISIYAICTILSPIFGNLSDQYGRKTFLSLGLLMFALSSGLMAVANDWTVILTSRAISGLSNAIFFPALLALIGDEYAYRERTRAMGLVRLSWPISFVFGIPIVGFSIEYLNWRLPFIVLGILALSTMVIIILMDSFEEKPGKYSQIKKPKLDQFKKVLQDRSAVSGLFLMLLAVGSIEGIFAYFSTWMETQFELGETTISIIYSFMGVGTLIGTLLAAGIADKLGPKNCAIIGLIISAGCMVLLSNFSLNPIFVIIWLLILGTSFDFSMTIFPTLLTQISPDSKGTILSLNQALNACGMAISTAISGLIWTNYGYEYIGFVFASTAFIGALIGYFNIQIAQDSTKSN